MANNTFNLDELEFDRAGSDFLGWAWSCHILGQDFIKGQTYTFVSSDGSSYQVIASNREPAFEKDGKVCWHMVDPEAGDLLG